MIFNYDAVVDLPNEIGPKIIFFFTNTNELYDTKVKLKYTALYQMMSRTFTKQFALNGFRLLYVQLLKIWPPTVDTNKARAILQFVQQTLLSHWTFATLDHQGRRCNGDVSTPGASKINVVRHLFTREQTDTGLDFIE